MKISRTILFISALLIAGCSGNQKQGNQQPVTSDYSFSVRNLSDEEYPDNPDIGFRSSGYRNDYFDAGQLDSTAEPFSWDILFFTKESDTILIKNMDIAAFMPAIPERVGQDDYLCYIACINQEWNRNQVRFNKNEFFTTNPMIKRVDVARNCLNAYLWEIIAYVEEDGHLLPYAHGWFDFPRDLYAQLFEAKNNRAFATYKSPLENWVDPENKKVNMTLLRTVVDTVAITFNDASDEMYPLAGARLKKYREIIHPDTFTTMRDLQSDSTLFATFTPPGFYNKKDPRKTELGRIYHLKGIQLYRTITPLVPDTLYELNLLFEHRNGGVDTRLVIGGLDFKDFPVCDVKDANTGWKNSMGIGNHTFYETYKAHMAYKAETAPYYAMFLDEKGQWLDSHKIGIDGPLFHFTDEGRSHLNLWLLSFERHAFAGHYKLSW